MSAPALDKTPDAAPLARASAGPAAVPAGAPLQALFGAMGNQAATAAILARSPNDGAQGAGASANTDIKSMSEPERLKLLRERALQGIPDQIQELLDSFGDRRAFSAAHPDVYIACNKLLPGLIAEDYPELLDKFEQDVIAEGHRNVAANLEYVEGERQRLGLDKPADTGPTRRNADTAAAQEETRRLASQVARALEAKERMRTTVVGYGKQGEAGASGAAPAPQPITFDPNVRPADGHDGPSWEEVHQQWRKVEELLGAAEAKSPVVFNMVARAGGDAAAAKATAQMGDKDDAETAAGKMTEALDDIVAKLEEADRDLGDDIGFEDLKPIHTKLLGGAQWSSPLNKAAAEAALEREGAKDAAIDTALAVGGMIAMIAASFATGGMATALTIAGAATGGIQAAKSWEHYGDLKKAHDARTGNKQHDLAEGKDVDAALLTAVLDTVFAVLDGFDAIKGLKAAKGAEAVKEAAQKVGKLRELAQAEREEVAQAAISEFGHGPAIEKMGGLTSARETLGKGSPATKQLEDFSKQASDDVAKDLAERRARAARDPAADPTKPAPAPGTLSDAEWADAQQAMARRADVAPGNAIETVAPGLADRTRMAELIRQFAEQPSAAWAAARTQMERVELLCADAIAGLERKGIPRPGMNHNAKGFGDAKMNAEIWEFSVNPKLIDKEAVTEAELASLKALMVHEARHAEQWFDMAKLAHQTDPGKSVEEVAGELFIDEDVVRAAFAKARTEPLDAAAAQRAREIRENILGAGRPERDKVLKRLDANGAVHKRLADAAADTSRKFDEYKQIEADPTKSASEKAMARSDWEFAKIRQAKEQTRWDKVKDEYERDVQTYKNWPEERDAYNVQGEWEAQRTWEREERARRQAMDEEAERLRREAAERDFEDRPTGEWPAAKPKPIDDEPTDVTGPPSFDFDDDPTRELAVPR